MSDNADQPRCTGKTAEGRPCRGKPIPGTTRCYHHSFRVPGRPSKLTAELTDQILDAILSGAYVETAAQAVGINKTTLYRWLRRADLAEANALEALEEHDLDTNAGQAVYNVVDPADWPYLDFRHALKSAEAFSEIELLRQATRGGPQPWQAYLTVLERRHPSRWARRDKVTHEGAVDLGRPKIIVPESEKIRADIARILEQAGAIESASSVHDQEDPPA